jgi:heat shock protein HslJ
MLRVVVLCAAGCLLACAGRGGPRPADGVEGRMWVLERFEGGPEAGAVPAGVRVTARFEDGTVYGSGGCNRYSGPCSLARGTIAVGALAATKMACPDPAMVTEDRFLEALGTATAIHTAGDVLTVVHPAGSLILREAPGVRLPGTSWSVTGFNNGKAAVVTTLAGTELSLDFAVGAVSGSAGCNAFTGPCTIEGNALRCGPLAATQKLCARPAGIMDQETQFLAALGDAATFAVDGERLEIFRSDGGRLVTASRR